MANDEQAIRDLIATWGRATEAGDLDSILPLMADDMVFLIPGHEPFGKDHFADHFRGMAEHVRIGVRSEIEEIHVSGDMAYCRQKLAVTVTPIVGGAATEHNGYALGVYRREGGHWVLARDANLVA
jgi:uncharacterized protein (TIGR02246 family)